MITPKIKNDKLSIYIKLFVALYMFIYLFYYYKTACTLRRNRYLRISILVEKSFTRTTEIQHNKSLYTKVYIVKHMVVLNYVLFY